jgi:hypothetical protein
VRKIHIYIDRNGNGDEEVDELMTRARARAKAKTARMKGANRNSNKKKKKVAKEMAAKKIRDLEKENEQLLKEKMVAEMAAAAARGAFDAAIAAKIKILQLKEEKMELEARITELLNCLLPKRELLVRQTNQSWEDLCVIQQVDDGFPEPLEK